MNIIITIIQYNHAPVRDISVIGRSQNNLYNISFRKSIFYNETVSNRGGRKMMGDVSFYRSGVVKFWGKLLIFLNYAPKIFYGIKQFP